MSFETEQEMRRKSLEAVEGSRESKELKEDEGDPELQKAAALERADILVKEVKSSKQQMQNIVLHMQQVTQTIQKLRKQLQLVNTNDPASLQQDKKRVDVLRGKIAEHQKELIAMRGDLVEEQIKELKKGIGVGLSPQELKKRAEEQIDEMIHIATKNLLD